MYTNSAITLYLKSKNYESIYIDKCFITQRKIATTDKNKLSYQESCFIMLPIIDVEFNQGKDFIVEGDCKQVIDNSTQENYVNSLNELKASNIVYTIMQADKKDYGSTSMRHMEISCK